MKGIFLKIFQKIKLEIGMPCNNCNEGTYIEIKKENTIKLKCDNCGYEPPIIKPIKKISKLENPIKL
jgi:DNA-directed RNA polymerase subunit M/transcription elongation factor TFIIS